MWIHLLIKCKEEGHFISVVFPQIQTPQSNQKKASEKLNLRGFLENAWPVLFKDVNGTKHKKGLGNFTHQRNRKACYWGKW